MRILFIAICCFAGNIQAAMAFCFSSDSLINTMELEIKKALHYIELSQIKQTDGDNAYEGEWPSYISNRMNIPFIGKGGMSAYDSNCFNTAFIHNTLATIYFSNPQYSEEIIPTLERAQKNILLFKTNETFNFWHLLDYPEHLQNERQRKNPEKYRQRRANHFCYKTRMAYCYANMFDDADDTSVGYLALYFSDSIRKAGKEPLLLNNSLQIGSLFSKYRDIGKRKTNWYNKKNGYNYRTGAFLTAFGPDRRHANFFTWFFPHKDKQNIFYGVNEVDCVVNANVLRALTLLNETRTEGFSESCAFVNDAFKNNLQDRCGVYYPTEFTLHYAASKALHDGVSCLEPSRDTIIHQILSSQNKDGSWTSYIENNDIQATLYALNALLYLGEYEKYGTLPVIEKAIRYVRASAIQEGEVTYWPGGVFFSGGTIIRYAHIWRSDAFTTALAAEALTQYVKILKNQK